MAAAKEAADPEMFRRSQQLQCTISTSAKLFGAKRIRVLQDTEIWHEAIIRGDLADVAIGIDTIIGAASVVRPPIAAGGASYVNVSIGSHTSIGTGVVCQASEVGSNVTIGDGAVLGARCRICDGASVLAGAVVPADTVVAPFAEAGGAPAAVTHRGLPVAGGGS